MAFAADFSALAKLAARFGPGGQEAALDIAEASVSAGAQAAGVKLGECVDRKWRSSRKLSSQVKVSEAKVSAESISATVVFKDQWAEVLAGGKNVPRHTWFQNAPVPMLVGKGGKEKKYKVKGKKGKKRRGMSLDAGGIVIGRAPGIVTINHPGYKGKDCVKPASKVGLRVMRTGIRKGILTLRRKLTGGGR